MIRPPINNLIVWYIKKDNEKMLVSSGTIDLHTPEYCQPFYMVTDLFDGSLSIVPAWYTFASKQEARHYLEMLKSANRNLD